MKRSTGMMLGKVAWGAAAAAGLALFAVPSVVVGGAGLLAAGVGTWLTQDSYYSDPEARELYRRDFQNMPLVAAMNKHGGVDSTIKIFEGAFTLLRVYFEREIPDGLLSTALRKFDVGTIRKFVAATVLPAASIQQKFERQLNRAPNFTTVHHELNGDLGAVLRDLSTVLDVATCTRQLKEKFRREFNWVGNEGQLYALQEIVGVDQGPDLRPRVDGAVAAAGAASPSSESVDSNKNSASNETTVSNSNRGQDDVLAPPPPRDANNSSNNGDGAATAAAAAAAAAQQQQDDASTAATTTRDVEAGYPLGLVRAFTQYEDFVRTNFDYRYGFFPVALQTSVYGKRTALPVLVQDGILTLVVSHSDKLVDPSWTNDKFLMYLGREAEIAAKQQPALPDAAEAELDNRARPAAASGAAAAASAQTSNNNIDSNQSNQARAALSGADGQQGPQSSIDLWRAEREVHLRSLLRAKLVTADAAQQLFHAALPIRTAGGVVVNPFMGGSAANTAPDMKTNICLFCEYWEDALKAHLDVLIPVHFQRAVAAAWRQRNVARARRDETIHRATTLRDDTVQQIDRQEAARRTRLERAAADEAERKQRIEDAADAARVRAGGAPLTAMQQGLNRVVPRTVHADEYEMRAERRAAASLFEDTCARARAEYNRELHRAQEVFVEDVERQQRGAASAYFVDNRAALEAARGASLNDDDATAAAAGQGRGGCAQQ